jgi:hypothetical protein
MSRYAPSTKVRISQRQHYDLRPTPQGWRFFPQGGPRPDGPSFASLIEALQWEKLADRRRFFKPPYMSLAPLLQTRTGAPREICLTDIPTIVYTPAIGGPREHIYSYRRTRIAAMMHLYGFKRWWFHYGLNAAPYCKHHCADHARFCRENDPPLMVMEDDAEPAWPCSHFVPPPDADRLHIGGDNHGISLARLLAIKKDPTWRRHRGYLWKPYNHDWFRQVGMLAYHAVIYLTRRIMDRIADYIPTREGAIDASVAELDHEFNIYAPTRCWWFQNDGHNGQWSFDFAPPELRAKNHPSWYP